MHRTHAPSLPGAVLLALTLSTLAGGNSTGQGSQPAPASETPAAEARNPSEPAPPATDARSAGEPLSWKGVDVSHYQGSVDWAQVRAAGYTFAFAKASGGTTELDPEFATNWEGMKRAGLVRGAYHFFHPDEDASAQAASFIATVTLEPGDLPPVLDIEQDEGVTSASIEADIRVWLEKVTAAYGVKPILYSDPGFIEKHLATGFSAYPLWLAEYAETPPSAPGNWAAWTFWQHSQTGQVSGIDGDVDLDVYRGTRDEWNRLLVR